MSTCRLVLLCFFLLNTSMAMAKTAQQFLPGNHEYQADIALPASTLGFELGARHIPHDQMVQYMTLLASSSDRVQLTQMGVTTEMRKQILLTISTPENLAKLDDILAARKNIAQRPANEPLVVWLGYSVHGDEISGTNASLIAAYHFAASQDAGVQQMLENTIIVMEPSLNPDGMDRFVNWVNTHGGITPNSDPNHIEHYQPWRTGRTNHFGFDLNRDWLLLSHQETQNRLKYFHQYRPHVLGDFHEMGANGTYFFQPGIPTRTHPLTPRENTKLTAEIATFHAKALDQKQRLYYSEESFDDFYYGKGSTYPDINGGIGILFEQASSRGMQQDTRNGLLTFETSIENQVLTSLSTVEGAWQNREKLKDYRKDFYQDAIKDAKDQDYKGYLIHEPKDKQRLTLFLEKLEMHHIKVFPLTSDYRLNNKVFKKDSSYYVPLAQAQYRVIRALFDQGTHFQDNTFYDVSGWTMPLAMNLDFYKVGRTWGLKLADKAWQKEATTSLQPQADAYAYVFEWHHYYAPKLLQSLLAEGIKARVATKSFQVGGQTPHTFLPGSILIPAGIQETEQWQETLANAAEVNGIDIYSLSTGLTPKGIDLGSGSIRSLKPVKILLVGGKGVSQYEAAEVLFYLDRGLNIPVTVVEKARLSRVDYSDYTHMIFVDGSYGDVRTSAHTRIESWAKAGGVIVAQKRGARWWADKGTLQASFVSTNQINQLFETDDLSYSDKEALSARKRIAGAIFETTLDTSHPLGYGFTDQRLPLFKNSTLVMDMPSTPFITVAQYTDEPLLSGYTDGNLVNLISNNAALMAHNVGRGRIIATSDNLSFRGYWHGSEKLLANAIFFGHVFSASANK